MLRRCVVLHYLPAVKLAGCSPLYASSLPKHSLNFVWCSNSLLLKTKHVRFLPGFLTRSWGWTGLQECCGPWAQVKLLRAPSNLFWKHPQLEAAQHLWATCSSACLKYEKVFPHILCRGKKQQISNCTKPCCCSAERRKYWLSVHLFVRFSQFCLDLDW